MPNGSRDVARTLTLAERAGDHLDRRPGGLQQVLAVVDDKQQPLTPSAAAIVAISGLSPCGVIPSTVAIAAG